MDILIKVLEAERDIQKKLEIEQKKSREFLEKIRLQADEKIVKIEEMAKESFFKTIEYKRRKTEKKAEKIIQEANSLAESYKQLNDELLKKIIKINLIRILPDKTFWSDDSQNVKD